MEENTPPSENSNEVSPPQIQVKDATVFTHPQLCLNLKIATLKRVNDLLTDGPSQRKVKLKCLEVISGDFYEVLKSFFRNIVFFTFEDGLD